MGSELYVYFDVETSAQSAELDELAADTGAESSSESGQIVARLDATSEAKRGERIELWMDPTKLHFFDLESGERIAAADES
jgi:multiple sugar transport system ATP-binding protein